MGKERIRHIETALGADITMQSLPIGCSMPLVSIPANPVPDGVTTGMIATPDGVSLRYARWAPPPNCKGTVCIIQGRTEYIEKYFETVRDLQARGFAVATFDWRGQGGSQRLLRSSPLKGYVRRFDDYRIDLETFLQHIVLPDYPRPLFALAHSMGGMALIRAVKAGAPWFDRVVISAPMLQLPNVPVPRLTRTLIRSARLIGLGGVYVPRRDASVLATAPFRDNPLTSDPVRYARNAAVIEADPSLLLGWPTVAWLDEAFKAMAETEDPVYPASIRQPMLLLAAGVDRVVSAAAIERFASYLRTGSHLMIPGARHELLMEQDRYRAQFWAAFDAFIPGTPSS